MMGLTRKLEAFLIAEVRAILNRLNATEVAGDRHLTWLWRYGGPPVTGVPRLKKKNLDKWQYL